MICDMYALRDRPACSPFRCRWGRSVGWNSLGDKDYHEALEAGDSVEVGSCSECACCERVLSNCISSGDECNARDEAEVYFVIMVVGCVAGGAGVFLCCILMYTAVCTGGNDDRPALSARGARL
jgi:hypothetical protein